jgi:lysozyme
MTDVLSITKPRIKKEEKLVKHLYKDSRGNTTGGYGHNFDAKGVSETIADFMLEEDLTDALNNCVSHISFWDEIDAVRQSVLLDMCFNLGIGGLMSFENMLESLKRKDYKSASEHMVKSLAYVQAPGRYHTLSQIMESGKLAD